jgi:hypothetical protein
VGDVVTSDIHPDTIESLEDILRPFKRSLHMGQYIFAADNFAKIVLLDKLCGLIARAAEQQNFAGLFDALGKYFDGVEARSVDSHHVTQAKYDDPH